MTIEWYQLALYAVAYAMMVAAPGPFAAAIAARSAAFGFRAGLSLAIGTWFGEKVWMLAAMFGLAAIAVAWADVLFVLKIIGAGWLIWLGLQLMYAVLGERAGALLSGTPLARRIDQATGGVLAGAGTAIAVS